jgi:hypothetical protein
MMDGLLIPVIVETIRSLKDGSISVNVVTQELSPGKAAELFALRNMVCFAYFSAKQIEANEKSIIDSMDVELKGKTPGQRLRNVMYIKWKNDNEGYPDAQAYYVAKMEAIIEHYKQDLP